MKKTETAEMTVLKKELDQAKLKVEIQSSVEKSNALFKKASPKQRRVLIAKDVLEQIKKRKIVPITNDWVYLDGLTDKIEYGENVQLQSLLHDPGASSCQVCAVGGIFLSQVRFKDNYIVNHNSHCESDALVLSDSFPRGDLQRIEAAYEMGLGAYGTNKGTHNYEASKWAHKFLSKSERKSKTKRMQLIMKNIIRNKGTFKHTQR